MNKLNVIDLFSGAGGFSEGFMQAGNFNFLAHIEWEKPMVETLRKNLVERWGYSKEKAKSVIHFDIQKTEELINGNWQSFKETNSKDLVEGGLNALITEKVDLIIGGPPCQAYSIAGRAQDPNQMKDDYRNYLFESFVKIVDYYKPKLFVFENVTGMLSAKPNGKLVIESIYEAFSKIGYEIKQPNELKNAVYSTMDFGVPQDRKRVIIIGVNKETDLKLEDFYHSLEKFKLEKKTVKDAISHLPKFKPLEKPIIGRKKISHEVIGADELHFARYHNLRDIEVFKHWIENDMNKATTIDKLKFYQSITGKNSKHVKYRNLEWDKPSPTIVAHLYKDGLLFIHPDKEQARTITMREAALLQTFPNDYCFVGSDAYKFKMIGNAVPVLFAKQIALSISSVLNQ